MPLSAKNWSHHLPIVEVARSYRPQDFPHDLVAGLVLGVVTIPQALAYAILAGLPAQAGLYACLAPMMVYAVLGSSRQLVVGPVAIAALMVAATVGEHAAAYSDEYLAIATVLSLQVGLFLWLLRLLRMGGAVSLLSHPVIAGFVNAAAVLIVLSQLGPCAGIPSSRDGSPLSRAVALANSLDQVQLAALVISVASLSVLWLARRTGPALIRGAPAHHPIGRAGPVLVAVAATAAVAALELDVETVGFVPAGLPALTVPIFNAALWWDLAPNAALIGLVAYVESYSVGKTLATLTRRRIDSHQELVALGTANVAAAFSGAYPVAGSFSRSGINHAAGGRTPVSVLICAGAIVIMLLWLTPLFENLPHAALAAIVIVSVSGLMDFRAIRRQWHFHRPDAIAHVATFVGVLAVGVEAGLLLGVLVSIALFLRGSSRPHIAVLGRLGDTPHFRNVERYAVHTWPHILAVRVDESLYFANAGQIESRLSALAARSEDVRHLVLVMSAVNFIDASGLEMLQRLTFHLGDGGVALHLCEAKGPVRDQLDHVDVAAWLSGQVFRTTDDAFNALTTAGGRQA